LSRTNINNKKFITLKELSVVAVLIIAIGLSGMVSSNISGNAVANNEMQEKSDPQPEVNRPSAAIDQPMVSISHVLSGSQVTLTSAASDASSLVYIIIFADENPVKSCKTSPCTFSTTFSPGQHSYYARAGFRNPSYTAYSDQKKILIT
jgi:hypothetical protein